MPLLPQQNNNVGKGRKKKEATATAAAAATTEPQQKRKRGRPPIQRILKPTAAVVPADPVEEPPTNLAADPSEVVQGGDRGEGWMHWSPGLPFFILPVSFFVCDYSIRLVLILFVRDIIVLKMMSTTSMLTLTWQVSDVSYVPGPKKSRNALWDIELTNWLVAVALPSQDIRTMRSVMDGFRLSFPRAQRMTKGSPTSFQVVRFHCKPAIVSSTWSKVGTTTSILLSSSVRMRVSASQDSSLRCWRKTRSCSEVYSMRDCSATMRSSHATCSDDGTVQLKQDRHR